MIWSGKNFLKAALEAFFQNPFIFGQMFDRNRRDAGDFPRRAVKEDPAVDSGFHKGVHQRPRIAGKGGVNCRDRREILFEFRRRLSGCKTFFDKVAVYEIFLTAGAGVERT